ncbi:MAG: hypothetical protein K8R88_07730, partial [Armatimonadetes bacterium]|nr:hypothetical protein [Armatimonadota bacterium]
YFEIAWSDIARVYVKNEAPGMPVLHIRSVSRRFLNLSMPLNLDDLEGFYQCVCDHAPPENPLRKWCEVWKARPAKEQ